MSKYKAFVAILENEITKDQETIVFGPRTTVSDILDVFDEETEDMRPCRIKGFTFVKAKSDEGLKRMIVDVKGEINNA